MTLALLPAPALGDGVLAMALGWAAHRAGREVLVQHAAMHELAAWYPWARIEPPADEGLGAAAAAEALFVGDPARGAAAAAFDGPCVVFGKDDWRRDRPYLESLRAAAEPGLGPLDWDGSSGVQAPRERSPEPRRIALHPTSANPAKDWPPARWMALAEQLREHAWRPTFLVTADAVDRWQAIADERAPVAAPGALGAVAAWLQDGAGCIGTDSGIVHLASALGVPSLALFRKRSAARFWGPAWPPHATIAPWLRLPGRAGHRFWRTFLTPARVRSAFERIAPGA